MTPRLLGVRDAAVYLGCTVWFVRSLVWNGEIPSCRLGKRLLIDRQDLDTYIEGAKTPIRSAA
jgi:excisionase family DNA binding protein